MARTRHENRGTCQACGKIHAVDAKRRTVAKHGYRVVFGTYNGVCAGGRGRWAALEEARDLNLQLRNQYATAAERAEVEAGEYERRVRPLSMAWNGEHQKVEWTENGRTRWKNERVYVPWAEATPEQQTRAQDEAAHERRREARSWRDYVRFLEQIEAARFGQSLYPAAEENVLDDRYCPGSRKAWAPDREGRVYRHCSVCGRGFSAWNRRTQMHRYEAPAHKK